MDDIAEDEKKVIEELKRRNMNDVTPKMLEDPSVFYRFAKARDFNLGEAEVMLKNHIAWRKEFQIDSILTDYEPQEVLRKYLPSSFVCFDKIGTVVRILECGKIDAKGIWNSVKKSDFAKYCVYLMERDKDMAMKRSVNEFGKKVFYIIYDFEGLTYANAVHMKTLQNIIYIFKMFMDNYPESIRVIYVINAPIYFKWIYAVMKPIIPPVVLQKLRIYGTDGWKDALLEDIDADDLPVYLGGNRTDPDGDPLCKTFILHAQPVPKTYYMQNRTKTLALKSDVEKLTVMPFSKEEITLYVKEENSYLEWEFETKCRDIDMSLWFRENSFKTNEHVELIPRLRIDTCYETEKGCIKCKKVGNYTIVFDNSYSWINSKEVYYKVRIKSPNDNELYSQL